MGKQQKKETIKVLNKQISLVQKWAVTLDENTTIDDIDNFFNGHLMDYPDTKSLWFCYLTAFHKCFEPLGY